MAKNRIIEPLIGIEDTCTMCHVTKDRSEFVKNRMRSTGRIRECKECRRRRNNENGYAKIGYWRGTTTGQLNRTLVREYKDRPCMDCGGRYPHYVMDLDHVRGKKLFILSTAYSHTREEVIAELEKCDVICSNCHRLRTFALEELTIEEQTTA